MTCPLAKMEGRDTKGVEGSSTDQISTGQHSPPKFEGRQREAVRDRARSWMFPEQITGSRVCVKLIRVKPLCDKLDSQTRASCL